MSKTKSANLFIPWNESKLTRNTNIETSNTIIDSVHSLGLYSIDALTDDGWLRLLAVDCGEREREEILRKLTAVAGLGSWNRPRSLRTKVLTGFSSTEPSHAVLPSPTESGTATEVGQPAKESEGDWLFSPEQILIRLESNNVSLEVTHSAILFAETTEFAQEYKPRLLSVLFEYIDKNRFCTEGDVVTVVGSAIRKYAMNMGDSDFEQYADWLLPSQTHSLGHELELELTKSASWRLTYVPINSSIRHPKLIRTLNDLCNDYLTPRLILNKNHASTVLHGIVGVAVLGAAASEWATANNLLRISKQLGIVWFTELLFDRLDETIASLSNHSSELSNRLREFVSSVR